MPVEIIKTGTVTQAAANAIKYSDAIELGDAKDYDRVEVEKVILQLDSPGAAAAAGMSYSLAMLQKGANTPSSVDVTQKGMMTMTALSCYSSAADVPAWERQDGFPEKAFSRQEGNIPPEIVAAGGLKFQATVSILTANAQAVKSVKYVIKAWGYRVGELEESGLVPSIRVNRRV